MLTNLYIDGRLENGSKKNLDLHFRPSKDITYDKTYYQIKNYNEFTEIPTTKDKITIDYSFGQRKRGISIDSENFKKLLQLITENKVNFGVYARSEDHRQKMIEMLTILSN